MRDLVGIGGVARWHEDTVQAHRPSAISISKRHPRVLHAAAEDSQSPVKMLGDCTVMPVSYGADGDKVEAGRVYLAPPDRHLIVTSPGVLGLAAGEKNHGSRPAADCLFESLLPGSMGPA